MSSPEPEPRPTLSPGFNPRRYPQAWNDHRIWHGINTHAGINVIRIYGSAPPRMDFSADLAFRVAYYQLDEEGWPHPDYYADHQDNGDRNSGEHEVDGDQNTSSENDGLGAHWNGTNEDQVNGVQSSDDDQINRGRPLRRSPGPDQGDDDGYDYRTDIQRNYLAGLAAEILVGSHSGGTLTGPRSPVRGTMPVSTGPGIARAPPTGPGTARAIASAKGLRVAIPPAALPGFVKQVALVNGEAEPVYPRVEQDDGLSERPPTRGKGDALERFVETHAGPSQTRAVFPSVPRPLGDLRDEGVTRFARELSPSYRRDAELEGEHVRQRGPGAVPDVVAEAVAETYLDALLEEVIAAVPKAVPEAVPQEVPKIDRLKLFLETHVGSWQQRAAFSSVPRPVAGLSDEGMARSSRRRNRSHRMDVEEGVEHIPQRDLGDAPDAVEEAVAEAYLEAILDDVLEAAPEAAPENIPRESPRDPFSALQSPYGYQKPSGTEPFPPFDPTFGVEEFQNDDDRDQAQPESDGGHHIDYEVPLPEESQPDDGNHADEHDQAQQEEETSDSDEAEEEEDSSSSDEVDDEHSPQHQSRGDKGDSDDDQHTSQPQTQGAEPSSSQEPGPHEKDKDHGAQESHQKAQDSQQGIQNTAGASNAAGAADAADNEGADEKGDSDENDANDELSSLSPSVKESLTAELPPLRRTPGHRIYAGPATPRACEGSSLASVKALLLKDAVDGASSSVDEERRNEKNVPTTVPPTLPRSPSPPPFHLPSPLSGLPSPTTASAYTASRAPTVVNAEDIPLGRGISHDGTFESMSPPRCSPSPPPLSLPPALEDLPSPTIASGYTGSTAPVAATWLEISPWVKTVSDNASPGLDEGPDEDPTPAEIPSRRKRKALKKAVRKLLKRRLLSRFRKLLFRLQERRRMRKSGHKSHTKTQSEDKASKNGKGKQADDGPSPAGTGTDNGTERLSPPARANTEEKIRQAVEAAPLTGASNTVFMAGAM